MKILSAFIMFALSSMLAAAPPGFVRTSGTHFTGPNGSPLILHGVNVANKNPKEGYLGDFGESDLDLIRSWGMNCIRLVILWDGLEPQPGKIDQAYLDRLAKIVELARRRGIYVLLDLHQDLYSVKFSDGAPAWATLDEGKPHTTGQVWDDSYATSEAVQTALDHFWKNTAGPDGVGLQDHYARVWLAVAGRFAREPAVIGYDLMNEPAPGIDFARARQAGGVALAQALAKRDGAKAPEAQQLAAMMATPQGQKRFLTWMGDPAIFRAMLDGMAAVTQNFERTELMPFYVRVARSIRQVDRNHILFLEPCITSGIGVPSAVTGVRDGGGAPDPLQAYAPHCYDLTTDKGPPDSSGTARLKIILANHQATARQLNMPLLIGEWGAFYEDPSAAEMAHFIVGEFDHLGCGDTYWSYSRALAKNLLLPALARRTR